MRKVSLINGEFYHVFNRSIAGFKIYNNDSDFRRFIDLIGYYRFRNIPIKYSQFKRLNIQSRFDFLIQLSANKKLINIVSYCIMPTHFHLILRQNNNDGIAQFISIIENSYSRYFNLVHGRKGPLWESRFQSVHIDTDEQLLHLTRYIHLNPVSAGLVDEPEEWKHSSYHEYFDSNKTDNICDFKDLINMDPVQYQQFTNDHKDHQRQIAIIKSQLIDNYTG